jgi:hypothetical protein
MTTFVAEFVVHLLVEHGKAAAWAPEADGVPEELAILRRLIHSYCTESSGEPQCSALQVEQLLGRLAHVGLTIRSGGLHLLLGCLLASIRIGLRFQTLGHLRFFTSTCSLMPQPLRLESGSEQGSLGNL